MVVRLGLGPGLGPGAGEDAGAAAGAGDDGPASSSSGCAFNFGQPNLPRLLFGGLANQWGAVRSVANVRACRSSRT